MNNINLSKLILNIAKFSDSKICSKFQLQNLIDIMITHLTIFQTEAYLKAYDIPQNCSIPINENIAIPGYYENGILKLFMPLLDESLLGYSRILELMKEFKVKEIILHSCYTDNSNNDGNKRRFILRENSNLFILLPESIEAYLLTLQDRTRRRIRSYNRNFFQTFSSVKCLTQYKHEVNIDDFMEIIRLKQERCRSKGFESAINTLYAEKLFSIVSLYGFITILKYENRVIAGIIGTRVGNEVCLHVISHDNSYNDFHIGYVILLKSIEQAIKDNIYIFNLLWGGNGIKCEGSQYRIQFGSQRKFLNDVTYYKYGFDYYKARFKYKYSSTTKTLFKFVVNHIERIYRFAGRKLKAIVLD